MNTTISAEIAAFAAAVRAELADLPQEERDELTDGLEADLTDRVLDAPEVALPDPAEYAAELRAAAGHPPKTTGGLPLRERMVWLGSDLRTGWAALRKRNAFVSAVVDFFGVLRPAWWVFRGIAVHAILGTVVVDWRAFGPLSGLAMAGFVVVSVQFGRGRWAPRRWIRGALVAVNVIVLLAAPALVAWTANEVGPQNHTSSEWTPPSGLTLNGNQVGNIFAYDAEGNPIEQVQLFDQNGDPLDLVDPEIGPFAYVVDQQLVPSDDVVGRAGWNIYPLSSGNYDSEGNLAEPVAPDFPRTDVRALASADDDVNEGEANADVTDADAEEAPPKP
jgi:hypothetical protein